MRTVSRFVVGSTAAVCLSLVPAGKAITGRHDWDGHRPVSQPLLGIVDPQDVMP